MSSFSIPSIFWTTIASLAAILSVATLIGHAWSVLFPYRFRAHARFYLAPALGMASITIIASLIGRVLPLGKFVIVPLFVVGLLIWSLVNERCLIPALRQALMVSIFGLVCGISVLAPIFVFGAFNAHNDAFTYLAHSNWLQLHAFRQTVAAESITPLVTQIALYQQGGYRMGGSYLLALFQAIFNFQWSYEVYPALIISAITSCCFAIGFPLAKALRPMRRSIRLALLTLPAFSLGGLVFGANMGFLPQTIGLALGSASLFAIGPLFKWATASNATLPNIGKVALPVSVLFGGATYAYTELAPFLFVAAVGSGFILALIHHAWGRFLAYGAILLSFSALLLNTELVRAYASLRLQSGAVVGTPVDWSLIGFVAHAFGVHGGAWDGFQWALPENFGSMNFLVGLLLIGFSVGLVLTGLRHIWRATMSGELLPSIIIMIVFAVGIVYFRYFVNSPFPKGLGQSWSQFKLADWAHPFTMLFVLLTIASLRSRLGKLFNVVALTLFTIGLISTMLVSLYRTKPLMSYYNGITDLNRFYTDFRKVVLKTCPAHSSIYLRLGGNDLKFRQMATLYLYDKEVRSNWMDDGYIYFYLPSDRRNQEILPGNCLVERSGEDGWLYKYVPIGPFQVGVFNGRSKNPIASVVGAYGRESDGKSWWYWVDHKVNFKLLPLVTPKNATQTMIRFEYLTRGKQTLTLRLIKHDGSSQEILLPSKGDVSMTFEKVINLPPSELKEVSIETDGAAFPLSKTDPRVAAWIIRNLDIQLKEDAF
jgi:hypothetical protein